MMTLRTICDSRDCPHGCKPFDQGGKGCEGHAVRAINAQYDPWFVVEARPAPVDYLDTNKLHDALDVITMHLPLTGECTAAFRVLQNAVIALQIARQPARPSPTAGMNLAQRVLHVGGRTNAAGYIEFGSLQAVQALVHQVLRDLPRTGPQEPPGA